MKRLVKKGLLVQEPAESEVAADESEVSSTSRSTASLNHEIKLLRYVEPRVKPEDYQRESRTARIQEWNVNGRQREQEAQKKRAQMLLERVCRTRAKMFKKSTEQKQRLKTRENKLQLLLLLQRAWSGVLLVQDYMQHATRQMVKERREKIEDTMRKISAMRILRLWRKRKVEQKIQKLTPKQKNIIGHALASYSRRISIRKQNLLASLHNDSSMAGSEHHQQLMEVCSVSPEKLARLRAGLTILKAFKFYLHQLQLAKEYLEKQWNIFLLSKLTINTLGTSPQNLPILREVVRERLAEDCPVAFVKPLTNRVLHPDPKEAPTEAGAANGRGAGGAKVMQSPPALTTEPSPAGDLQSPAE